MSWFRCTGGAGSGINPNKQVVFDGVLPDGYTNVDVPYTDYAFKSYGLYVNYNGVVYKADSVLLKKGYNSSMTYRNPLNSSDNVGISISWYSTYVRLRIGSSGSVPMQNVPVVLFTTDIDIESFS